MINVELKDLGYLAHQSHDGGGMYQTVVILWGTALEQHKHYEKEQQKRETSRNRRIWERGNTPSSFDVL
jgi:hypothetical protein